MHALRKIQRYWRVFYAKARENSARKIQKHVRIMLGKMDGYRAQLKVIRSRLLNLKLKQHLFAYAKGRRVQRGFVRPNILDLANRNLPSVLKI